MYHEWGRRGMHVGYWWESQKEDQDVGRWTILKLILDKEDGMGWYELNRSVSGYGPMECSCEHGNKLSCTIKCWEVLE
jgi:hypothetical protein